MNDCLHGCSGAVGIFRLDAGCVAFPKVKIQVLCWQHAESGRDGAYCCIELVQDLTSGWFGRRWAA